MLVMIMKIKLYKICAFVVDFVMFDILLLNPILYIMDFIFINNNSYFTIIDSLQMFCELSSIIIIFSCRDFIFSNKSFGKKIFRLEIISINGNLKKMNILKKNIIDFMMLPLSLIAILIYNNTYGCERYKLQIIHKQIKPQEILEVFLYSYNINNEYEVRYSYIDVTDTKRNNI